MKDDIIIIGDKLLQNFFISDLKNIWNTSLIPPVQTNNVINFNNFQLDEELTRLLVNPK